MCVFFSSLCNVHCNTLLLKWYPRPNRRNIHPISAQNGKIYTLFQTRNAWKWYPLGRHIPVFLSTLPHREINIGHRHHLGKDREGCADTWKNINVFSSTIRVDHLFQHWSISRNFKLLVISATNKDWTVDNVKKRCVTLSLPSVVNLISLHSLTRNITSHSIKYLALQTVAYSDERWLYYQFSLHHLQISLQKVGRIYFLNLGVKGLNKETYTKSEGKLR